MDAQPVSERRIARITLPAEARYLAPALAFVREVAGSLGLAAPDVSALERAAEEVASNVIRQAFEPGQPASFDMVLLRRPGQLVLAVEDKGLPYDWQALEAKGGAGPAVATLAGQVDAIRFSSLGTEGNRVEVVKRLPFAPIDAYPAADAAPAAAPARQEPVMVRLMTPDEAIAVARLTYRCYGYTVPDDYLYSPDHVREMLAGGLLEICVGVTADGEIVSRLTRPAAPTHRRTAGAERWGARAVRTGR